MAATTWGFRGTLLRVIDGDTYDLRIDMGFRIFMDLRVRLRGLDTPEMHAKDESERLRAGAAARAAEVLLTNRKLWVETYKDQTFDRWVADVYLEPDRSSLADMLRAGGHAK